MVPLLQPQHKLQVAICGCGIGGLGLAIALSKYAPDIKVDIYEAFAKPGELGLGITLTWRTAMIVDELGLREEIESIGGQFDFTKLARMVISKEDQEPGERIPTVNKPEVRLMPLHRGRLYSALSKHIGTNCTAYMSKRVVSYIQPKSSDEPITIYFADGTNAPCDILIGSDGIKSSIRASMVEELALLADAESSPDDAANWRSFAIPSFTGIVMRRTMFPAAKLEQLFCERSLMSDVSVFIGKGTAITSYPVDLPTGRSRYMSVSTLNSSLEGTSYPEPWAIEEDAAEMIDCAAGWSKDARDLIAAAEGPVKKWAIHTIRGMPAFSHGRVAVLGDAAHAMAPQLGSGAGQALEDAYCLARLLAHPRTTRENASQALKAYSQIRQPIAQKFVESSRMMCILRSSEMNDVRSPSEIGERVDALTEILAEGSPLEDTEEALKLFESWIN